MDKYQLRAQELLDEILQVINDEKWTTMAPINGVDYESRPFHGSNILTIKASGAVNADPHVLSDYLWNMKKEAIKYHDPTMKEFEMLYFSDSMKIMRHVSKIIFPIKDRELIYCACKIYRRDEIFHINFSIDLDDHPINNELHIRAQLNFSIVIFSPISNSKTKVYTIINLDPRGQIPSLVINSYYSKVGYYIHYWKNYYE